MWHGGEGEIRTHGTVKPYARFRVWCIRPLCHLSVYGSFLLRVYLHVYFGTLSISVVTL